MHAAGLRGLLLSLSSAGRFTPSRGHFSPSASPGLYAAILEHHLGFLMDPPSSRCCAVSETIILFFIVTPRYIPRQLLNAVPVNLAQDKLAFSGGCDDRPRFEGKITLPVVFSFIYLFSFFSLFYWCVCVCFSARR